MADTLLRWGSLQMSMEGGYQRAGAAEERLAGADTPFLEEVHRCVPQDSCHGTGGLQLNTRDRLHWTLLHKPHRVA